MPLQHTRGSEKNDRRGSDDLVSKATGLGLFFEFEPDREDFLFVLQNNHRVQEI